MVTIDRAIEEAQADEMAEREVNNKMNSGYKNAPASNTVTIALDEYISLYNSTDKYCKLLAIISGLVKYSAYRNDNIALEREDDILAFLKYNEMDIYAELLKHVLEERGEGV